MIQYAFDFSDNDANCCVLYRLGQNLSSLDTVEITILPFSASVERVVDPETGSVRLLQYLAQLAPRYSGSLRPLKAICIF